MKLGSILGVVLPGSSPTVAVSQGPAAAAGKVFKAIATAFDPRRVLESLVPGAIRIPVFAGAGVFGAPVVFMSSAGDSGGSTVWTREKIESRLLDLVVEQLEVERGVVTRDSNFTEELGADSLAVMELVMALEKAFEIEVPDEEANTMRTFGDAVNFVANKLGVS